MVMGAPCEFWPQIQENWQGVFGGGKWARHRKGTRVVGVGTFRAQDRMAQVPPFGPGACSLLWPDLPSSRQKGLLSRAADVPRPKWPELARSLPGRPLLPQDTATRPPTPGGLEGFP